MSETYRTLYEGLMEKLKEAGVTAGLRSNNIRSVDKARVPTAPSEPNVPRNLTFALALGLTTGIGLAFLLEGIDNTVRTPEQAQVISGLPSLGMIPLGSKNGIEAAARRLTVATSREAVELVTQSRPQSQMAEVLPRAAHILVADLARRAAQSDPGHQCSAARGQDHDQHQHRDRTGAKRHAGTVDRRRPAPSQHSQDSGHGSQDRPQQRADRKRHAATGRGSFPSSANSLHTPAGTPPPNPAELLASSNMRDILAELREAVRSHHRGHAAHAFRDRRRRHVHSCRCGGAGHPLRTNHQTGPSPLARASDSRSMPASPACC